MLTDTEPAPMPPRVPVYNNPKIRAIVYQLVLLTAVTGVHVGGQGVRQLLKQP